MSTRPEPLDPLVSEQSGDGLSLSDPERHQLRQRAGRHVVSVLYRWRRFIAAVTVAAAVLAVGVSLLLPNWYAATARVLSPESSIGGGLAALVGNLSPAASSLLKGSGGGNAGYTRYLAILNSRSMQDAVVDRFNLVEVYDLSGKPYAQDRAASELMSNLSIGVDMEYDFLYVTAHDRDPERAAAMANFLVDELNRRHQELGAQHASSFRRYVEGRYREVETRMAEARAEMQQFQERHGVIELPTMAEGLMESAAAQQADLARLEIEHAALLSQYGPENPRVRAAQQALAAARRVQGELLGGREALLPVALRDMPAVANEYARLYQELLIQRTLMEEALPLLEQARFDEERERVAVQVLDTAAPPARKAFPRRSLIVLITTFSTALLACLFALAYEATRRRRLRPSTLAAAGQP